MKKIFLLLVFSALTQLISAQNWFETSQSADLMLSGAGFNQTGGALLFNHPSGIASDGSHFLVCDRFNNRILVWNQFPTSTGQPADTAFHLPSYTARFHRRLAGRGVFFLG